MLGDNRRGPALVGSEAYHDPLEADNNNAGPCRIRAGTFSFALLESAQEQGLALNASKKAMDRAELPRCRAVPTAAGSG